MTAQAPSYRWNTSEAAEAYDRAAPEIHPYYEQIQNEILAILPFKPGEQFSVVDLGGGSGRLAERVASQFSSAQVAVVDQSEPFLALAERRLRSFAARAQFIRSRMQDDWPAKLPAAPDVIFSTSAIHHLEPHEKRALFEHCFSALKPGGMFINGDEHRPASDEAFLSLLKRWSEHMRGALDSGRIPATFGDTRRQWQERNIGRFGEPKKSGDDCLEVVEAQQSYLLEVGFADVRCAWAAELWGIVIGRKPEA